MTGQLRQDCEWYRQRVLANRACVVHFNNSDKLSPLFVVLAKKRKHLLEKRPFVPRSFSFLLRRTRLGKTMASAGEQVDELDHHRHQMKFTTASGRLR